MNDNYILSSGMLAVGDGHKIYWEEWGNPKAFPIFLLHGGPGGGFSDQHKLFFNPLKHRVIFFDQRGAGKSTPYANLKHNTTQDLIADIEKLRQHLKIKQFHLKGRSWGSTLALAYAISYPKNIKRMLLGGIYLGTPAENNFITEGYVKYLYPEAWQRFISLVPKKQQKDGSSITQYYVKKINSTNLAEAKQYADEWTLWEASTISINYNKKQLEIGVLNDDNLAIAKLETHYFINDCFMPENYILDNIAKIKNIPCYVVQGRLDNCTPPVIADQLAKAYGNKLILQWVNAGHKGSDPEIMAAEQAVLNTFLT